MKRVRLEKFQMDCVIGIDPGLSGAIAFFASVDDLMIIDVPSFEASRGKQVDLHKLVSSFNEALTVYEPKHAFIENVHTMPKQGISSAFKFGKTCAYLEMLIAAFSIPITLVTPQEWKKELKVQKHKDNSRLRASQLLPEHANMWPLKKHHNRAEAILIAYYGNILKTVVYPHIGI